MKRMMMILAGGAVLMAVVVAGVQAAEEAEAKPAGVPVTLTGKNYCLLSTLAKEAMSDANSSLASMNALEVTSAKNEAGEEMEGLKGVTLHYLPSKAAEPLLLGETNQGKTVTVKGTLFQAASSVLVVSFEAAAGGDGEWDDIDVGGLSGQPVI